MASNNRCKTFKKLETSETTASESENEISEAVETQQNLNDNK